MSYTFNPFTGTLDYYEAVVAGAGNATVQRQTFDNTDLAAGVLTVAHTIGEQYVNVIVINNNDLEIEPDSKDFTGSNAIGIDLSSYGTLTGTWRLVITG